MNRANSKGSVQMTIKKSNLFQLKLQYSLKPSFLILINASIKKYNTKTLSKLNKEGCSSKEGKAIKNITKAFIMMTVSITFSLIRKSLKSVPLFLVAILFVSGFTAC